MHILCNYDILAELYKNGRTAMTEVKHQLCLEVW